MTDQQWEGYIVLGPVFYEGLWWAVNLVDRKRGTVNLHRRTLGGYVGRQGVPYTDVLREEDLADLPG